MSRQLSQEEIDSIIALSEATAPAATAAAAADAARRVARAGFAAYNFRRPDRVSKEQLRSLHFLHDRFAVNVSTSLSVFLRAMTEVNIVACEQFAYSEFLMSLPDPTAFYAIGLTPLEGLGALEINPAIAFTMVDRMLGGAGHTTPPNRALTEIEQNVLDAVVRLLLEHLTETWKAIVDVQFRIQGRETRPQMLQITGPNEIVIHFGFEIKLGDKGGSLRFCIPAAAIESMQEKVAHWHRARREPTAAEATHLHANLGRVSLPVSALLETRLAARELLAIQPGDVLTLGRPAVSAVDVHVGQVRRFTGHLTMTPAGAGVAIDRASNGELMVQAPGGVQ